MINLKQTKSMIEALSMDYNVSLYKKKYFYSFIKRFLDIVNSLLFMILFSWLFLIIAIIIKLTSKGPILFGHERIGKNGKKFKVWKFRTMKIDKRPLEEIFTKEQLEEYKRDFKVTNDPRITKFGKFLRKTSLDELPQFWNVFVGQMSFIGYRPIIDEEFEKYGENQALLTKCRPGITGYWASHGRSLVRYEDRIKFELYYNVKRSFWLDIRIIYHTIVGVFREEGAK